MTYEEFINWCHRRACTGHWTIEVCYAFMAIAKDVNKHLFKERYWKKRYKRLVEIIIQQVERAYEIDSTGSN